MLRLFSLIPVSLRQWGLNLLWRLLNARHDLDSGLVAFIRDVATWRAYGEVFARGAYDPAIDAVIAEHPQGTAPLVIDLGANVGLFALRFADRWLTARGSAAPFLMIGLEGAPPTYHALTRSLAQPVLTGRAHYRLGLAGKREGQARITTARDHLQNTILPAEESAKGRRVATVEYVDVDQLVREHVTDDARVALLKVDIEGAEIDFLQSYPGLLARTDRVVIEIHRDRLDGATATRLLEHAGLHRVRCLGASDPQRLNTLEFFTRRARG